MKSHSIARRVVTLFFLIELLSALAMTAFVFLYERQTHFHSLDVAIHGHADTIMGAVVDSEDVDDHVVLDMEGLQVPSGDFYEAWSDGRDLLGRSPGWTAPSDILQSSRESTSLSIHGDNYRTVRITGVRRVDPAASGILHHIVVVYASPTRPAWAPVFRAVRAFSLASLVLVLLSLAIVHLLVQSSMSPLNDLASDAGTISSSRWAFAPSPRTRQTRELAPLVSALEDLIHRLHLSFAQQRQFVSDSAHELKTAVTVVKSSLQLTDLRARLPEEYRQGISTSLDDCQRLEDLVYRMLALARVEEASSLAHPAPPAETDLAAVSCASIASIASAAHLRGIRLETTTGRPLYATIAAEDWQTVCTNILFNAVQHSPSGTRVLITLEQHGTRALCHIADQGHGIAPDALPFIFNRFFRSDASRARATGGIGLGLAICKALVERAGGSISAQSTLGAGTTLTVDLPLATNATNATNAISPVASATPAVEPLHASLRA